jgi:hypothetical protein
MQLIPGNFQIGSIDEHHIKIDFLKFETVIGFGLG